MNILQIIKQFDFALSAEDIIYLAGVALLGAWLLKTAFGTKTLVNAPPRRNNMPIYLPLIPLAIWLIGAPAAMKIMRKSFPHLPDWQQVFADNLIMLAAAAVAITITLILVRKYFARRLKGFGLNPKTIPTDFFSGLINLVTVWPVVMLAVVTTIYIGQLIWGTNFQLPKHDELKSLLNYSQTCVRAAIIITAVVVAPIFEEFVFRGLFQTLVRSRLNNPWLAIFTSSILFASSHANTTHWPALFALSIGIGYSYEKSGSLFRPVFIHALFNATSIIATLLAA